MRVLLRAPRAPRDIGQSIARLRRQALHALSQSVLVTTDIKTGLGGMRDIEFLAQGLQLVHAHERPEVLQPGTLPALKALGAAGVLPGEEVEQLSSDYLFLRRMEHFLQIYEDRQTHALPSDPAQLRALARLLLGGGATADELTAKLAERCLRVQRAYDRFQAELSGT